MIPNVEQTMNSSKVFLESQTNAFKTLASAALESTEKVTTLNLAAMKASAADASNVLNQATSARDPQALFALMTSQFQPNAEKAASYARYLGEIFAETQSVFSKTAEAQIAEVSRVAAAMVDQVAAASPTGSSDAMALVKSMMGTANAAHFGNLRLGGLREHGLRLGKGVTRIPMPLFSAFGWNWEVISAKRAWPKSPGSAHCWRRRPMPSLLPDSG